MNYSSKIHATHHYISRKWADFGLSASEYIIEPLLFKMGKISVGFGSDLTLNMTNFWENEKAMGDRFFRDKFGARSGLLV
ncbi:MAG: hypothetical protein VKJ64_17200 [Leptolyngbyaceae bacterium]|nr:hypothetical protein [Leptolyngbyaceae bacterium]